MLKNCIKKLNFNPFTWSHISSPFYNFFFEKCQTILSKLSNLTKNEQPNILITPPTTQSFFNLFLILSKYIFKDRLVNLLLSKVIFWSNHLIFILNLGSRAWHRFYASIYILTKRWFSWALLRELQYLTLNF